VLTAVLALTLASSTPWGTGQSRGEDLTVMLVTFSPGDDLFSWWGHSALVVQDERLNVGRLYNYGMFGFDQKTLWKFVQGRLEFWVGEASVGGTLNFYKLLNRDVRLQELDLEPDQRLKVAKALDDNVQPENRTYLYHHYNDNCATRPRDMVDLAVGGQLKAATAKPARMGLRHHTRRYSLVSPPMSVVLDYLQSHELDRPITMQQEAFLPDELERQVDALVVTHADGSQRPLVKKKVVWFQSDRPKVPETPPSYIPHLLALGFATGGAAFGLGRAARNKKTWARRLLGLLNFGLGLVWGTFGLFLTLVWLFTDHEVAHHNENLFLIHFVQLAAVPYGIKLFRGKATAWNGLYWTWVISLGAAVLGLALKVLPPFYQNNWTIIALALPIIAGLAATFWEARRGLAP
jgi:Domain of unknown function (DUF4105)